MLTDKKIDAITYEQWGVSARYLYPAYRVYARAIEATATAPLLARIAELERQLAQPVGEPVALKVYKGEVCYKSQADDQSFGMWCPVTYEWDHGLPEGHCFYSLPAHGKDAP
jgi:hypothetical protein